MEVYKKCFKNIFTEIVPNYIFAFLNLLNLLVQGGKPHHQPQHTDFSRFLLTNSCFNPRRRAIVSTRPENDTRTKKLTK
jgi:hypothetical protein